MLIARDLTVRLGAFTGRYDLAVARGALVAIVGASGGGKSTLLNAIAGFETPQGGTLRFDGEDLLPRAPARRPVAMIFQDHNLLPNLTAAQNAGLALSPSLRLTVADRAKVSAMLADVGLAGLDDRLPSQLSGGQRQRVALARALLTTRPLLLLDEPFSGLDPVTRREMALLIDRLRRERGLTVLLVTHTPEDIADLADAILRIEEGRIADETKGSALPPQAAP